MDWGGKAAWLLKVSISKNLPIPSAIASKPELLEDVIEAWEAFDLLGSTRQYNSGFPQPILLSEISAYINLFNIKYDIDKFIQYIKYLDTIYLEKVLKK